MIARRIQSFLDFFVGIECSAHLLLFVMYGHLVYSGVGDFVMKFRWLVVIRIHAPSCSLRPCNSYSYSLIRTSDVVTTSLETDQRPTV